ncbi:MAG: VWA domain-containing protein, partial [Planctomycetes bacterium]|nr:VWA domain-containing protein [Planctomycetota bacterium]
MARPYSESDSAVVSSGQPVHAILVVDNSLSMAYGTSGQTTLDSAKKAAIGLVEDLPDGSRFSIIPLCGEDSDFSFDPEGTKDAAGEAIKEIRVLDRTASVAKGVELAEEASKRAPDLRSKHIVFFGDQQSNCWPKGGATSGLLASIDKLNVVQVSPGDKDNIWIEDLRVQDEVADADAATVFIVRLRYQGEAAQDEVQVSLNVDGDVGATKSVVLRDKQTREVLFTYKYELDSSAVQSGFSRVKAMVSPHDKFSQDDVRYLSVPVLSGIPVVFIDQYGSDEDPVRNRLGDTYYVRRLLTPSHAIDSKERQLIRIQHVKIDQVDTELLEYARLVVMAGVENPGPAVDVLREYVEQGGQLFIAAGGNFDPVAWNEEGWNGGKGILPSPLQPIAVGKLPGDGVKELNPFFISFDSLATDSFLPQEESNQNLEDIYSIPLFFKAVVADLEGDAMKNYLKVEREKVAVAEKAAQDAV